ncbi:PAAR motif family protein [Escherichia coli 2-427-07_S1_C2]|nr:zincin-like metallopeptidase toxin domain-containing protein [Escherichia coli]EFH9247140.1 hypothetical protein [Escherichia coli]KDY22702.1 PAAR motif family protein [Escherichia coli 2-427-07_S1_C2]KDZ91460.1 PAAR motif family protein [Escherichia coli 2-427-07_S1_C1]MDD8298011.1 PAAR domain-containing protein [Escherichia coli]MXE36842.1 hypothetical protein [Escherichia coli]
MSEGPGGPQGATAGGTLAMRMLSQQAMVASQMKRAANDKAIAQMLASKKSGPPAARLGDEIQHKSFLGALAGAVLGAIVTIAEGCLIMAACATGPYALVLVPALMYASYKASDYVEEKQNQLESWINSFCDTDGAINTGSENVKINGKPAARAAVTLPPPPPPGAIPEVPQGEPSWGDIATDLLESAAEKAVPLAKAWGNAVITLTDSNAGFMDRVSAGASLLFPAGPVLMEFATMVGGRGEIKKDVDFPEAGEDTALCDKENKPPRIAQGSSNVFINNQPAARQGDKLECSAAIVGGSPDVFIGGEQVTYLDIQPEFPPWQRMILGGITIASYLLPPAGLLGKLKNLARLGKLGNLLGKSGKLLGAKLGALLGKTGKSLKSIANKVIRWVTDPVDPVTGAYCDERTDFTLGQTLPLSFTRFHSSVLPLHGLTGVGWSDSWSEYAWVREQGNRVDIISLGATLNFAFDGESDTAVSGHTGFLDGVRLSRSQINNIAKEMEKLGIKVIRKADKYLPPNARAAFDYGLRNIYLRKNATLYEVYHEVIHAKQFAKIGREAYEALGRLSREEHVLNEILKSKNLFNEAEIAHAIKYVEGLREKFMMGLTN